MPPRAPRYPVKQPGPFGAPLSLSPTPAPPQGAGSRSSVNLLEGLIALLHQPSPCCLTTLMLDGLTPAAAG